MEEWKKVVKMNSVSGVFLDADQERLMKINLPLVRRKEQVFYGKDKLANIELEYGEFAFLGDFHYGHEDFSTNVLHGYLNYLKQRKNIRIGLMGDIIEYGAGRNYIREELVNVDEQREQFVADFRPLKDRIDFMLWGNHEEAFVRKNESKKLMEDLARELGLEPGENVYVGEPQKGIFAIFQAGEKEYGAQIHHSSTRAAVNQDIQLTRTGSQNVVAMIVHGHTHRLTWKPRTFRTLENFNGKMMNVVKRQYLLSTGCFLRYPGYAESKSMPYTEVGAPIIKFHSRENNLQYYDLTGFYKAYLAKGGCYYEHGSKQLANPYLAEAVRKVGCRPSDEETKAIQRSWKID